MVTHPLTDSWRPVRPRSGRRTLRDALIAIEVPAPVLVVEVV